MRSFAVRIEPAASPRLAAALLLLHLVAAAVPWLARVPAPVAGMLSALALAGIVLSMARVPGRHCRLAEVRHDGVGWFVRLAGSARWQPAELHPASRAYPALACVAFRAGGRRLGWLLPAKSVSPAEFRRLKARVRLA